MGAWPDLTEYHEAVQHPPKAFADPGLKGVTLELDRFGMPKPATGGNAVVYKANEPGGFLTFKKTWAIRCFLRPISDHAERYEAATPRKSATVPTNIPNVAGKTTAKRLIVFQLSSFICRWRRWRGMSPCGNVFIPATI